MIVPRPARALACAVGALACAACDAPARREPDAAITFVRGVLKPIPGTVRLPNLSGSIPVVAPAVAAIDIAEDTPQLLSAETAARDADLYRLDQVDPAAIAAAD